MANGIVEDLTPQIEKKVDDEFRSQLRIRMREAILNEIETQLQEDKEAT